MQSNWTNKFLFQSDMYFRKINFLNFQTRDFVNFLILNGKATN